MAIFVLAAVVSEDVDYVVPEAGLVQAEAGMMMMDRVQSFLTAKEQTTCQMNVDRCFSSDQHPSNDPCQQCTDSCAALQNKGNSSQETLTTCKKSCDSKCIWAYQTKSFVSTYKSLCATEITHKKAIKKEAATKEKTKKEKKVKNEKSTKKAGEMLIKCKAREANHKKVAAKQTARLEEDLEVAQKNEKKLSKSSSFYNSKIQRENDEQETKLFNKEQLTKESGFKRVARVKNNAEVKTKTLREQLFKSKKITYTIQENIYKDWTRKLNYEKDTKLNAASHVVHAVKKVVKKVMKAKPKVVKTMTVIAEKEPVIPPEKEDCKCSFPFMYGGAQFFGCLETKTATGTLKWCLDASGKKQECVPHCQAVWEVAREKKAPRPAPRPSPRPTPRPSPVDVVPAPKPAPPTPISPYQLKLYAEEKKVKAARQQLRKVLNNRKDPAECKAKVAAAQMALDQVQVAEVVAKKEVAVKAEKGAKAENKAKEQRIKEAQSKELANKQYKAHQAVVMKIKKESAEKVATFKMHEGDLKIAAKEKRSKHPFGGLSIYCESLQKLKLKFAQTKETGIKKVKEMAHKNAVTKKVMTEEFEAGRAKLRATQCVETKEVCGKIHFTSEKREKHAAVIAAERKKKLKAKCVLAQKYEKADAEKLKFTICAAAHKEIVKVLNTIEHKEEDALAVEQRVHATVKYKKFAPFDNRFKSRKIVVEKEEVPAKKPVVVVQNIPAQRPTTVSKTMQAPVQKIVAPAAVPQVATEQVPKPVPTQSVPLSGQTVLQTQVSTIPKDAQVIARDTMKSD